MANKCVLCGASIATGIVCAKCDPPSRKKDKPPTIASREAASGTMQAIDPFPKAPVLPFPVEATSPAATSISEILAATRLPAALVSPDGSLRFISEEGKQLPGLSGSLPTLQALEHAIGVRIPDLKEHYSAPIQIGKKVYEFTVIPLSGGNGGAVLLFRPNASESLHLAYVTYLREAVLTPMRALREALIAASRNRGSDPLLQDAASTIDQILSSLELSPVLQEDRLPTAPAPQAKPQPVLPVLRKLNTRFAPIAEVKDIAFQLDVPAREEQFSDPSGLESALATLLENALHYAPRRGQIVLGLRSLEHKGRNLLLFFVMDNGPIVPELLRESIFTDEFVWDSADPQRTGHGLARIRKFAMTHGGQVWVESKTGKACTFFLRLRPS